MKRLRIIIYVLSAMVALAIPLFALFAGKNAVIPCAIGALILLIMMFFMDRLYSSYMDDRLLIDLSNLIESIIDTRAGAIFSDVEDTLLSKLQSQVIKLSGILKAQNKSVRAEKDEIQSLISDISHQIKTPVASIKMFGELLQDNSLTEQQRGEYLDMLGRSLDKLTFLTDSMIKMSRLESGIIRLSPQTADLNDVILQAVKQVYPKAKNRHIDISFDAGPALPLYIDKKWTAEAIFNILDNAVKYTPHAGTAAIGITKYESFVRVDIADNGMGIPEEEQAKIWGRFYRGEGTDDTEGVGIGLYLTRKIITGQGGYTKVQSDGNGSVFSVFLPLGKSSAPETQQGIILA